MPSVDSIQDNYLVATSADIRSWSSGSVKRRLQWGHRRDDWTVVADTLWDQRTFGPVEDLRCACGKFFGTEFVRLTCDICRVKVSYRKARTIRFGHINLPIEIPHPFVKEAEPLDAVPIVPAYYWETREGAPLADAYEELVHQTLIDPTQEDLIAAYGTILAILEHRYEQLQDHEIERAKQLARGMAMKEPPSETEVHSKFFDDDTVDWDNLTLRND